MRGGYGLAEWRSKEEVVVPWASSLGPAAPWRRGRRVDGGVDGAGSRWGSGVGAGSRRRRGGGAASGRRGRGGVRGGVRAASESTGA